MRSIRLLALLFVAAFFYSCDENVEPETTQVPVNRLEARAGVDQQVLVNEIVALDGGSSKDGNGKSFAFNWLLKGKPVGSAAILNNSESSTPTLQVDKVGNYVIELKISQGSFIDTDEVVVHVTKEEQLDLPELLSEDINESRLLKDLYHEEGKPDYLVTDFIRVNASLRIEPGVIIAFERDKGLQVDRGELIAVGTEENKITFTGVEKTPGFWKGIAFISNSTSNEFDHVVVEYGGSSAFIETLSLERANVILAGDEISGSTLKISNSEIDYSGGYGLYVRGMSSLTRFENNRFYDNTGIAVSLTPRVVHSMDALSTFAENGFDGVETGGTLGVGESPARWTALGEGKPYLISSDLSLQSGVVISEGAVLKFKNGVSMTVTTTGYLSALGTETSPVIFTALVNFGGNNWKGLMIESVDDNNRLDNTEVSYAGNGGFAQLRNGQANIGVMGSVTIQNSHIHHGNGWGIVVTDGLINNDVESVNRFNDLASGNVKRKIVYQPVEVAGDWMDWWSMTHDRNNVSEDLYDRENEIWFGGAADPWSMANAGFGLKIKADGSYVWTIAIAHSEMGCVSYSAEHFTGTIQNGPNELTFVEDTWRSKFYFSCDESMNVDMEVEPGQMTLPFETLQETIGGKTYDVLKLWSGGEPFKYYRLR